MINKRYIGVGSKNRKLKSKSYDFNGDSSLDKIKNRKYEVEYAGPYINLPNIQKEHKKKIFVGFYG